MASDQSCLGRPPKVDFELIFDRTPGMCLVLDTTFRIIAQNADHAKATLSADRSIVGKGLFEVFPDNPTDWSANGIAAVRQSLLDVMKTRRQHVMPIIRYDVEAHSGDFQERYWAITNTPILGEDGFVRWIINRADDVTEFVLLRRKRYDNAAFCRKQANAAAAFASKSLTKGDREAFLKLAEDWESVANDIEPRPSCQ